MRFYNIASGSTGNCTYIGTEDTHLLVDAGISVKKIIEGINSIGVGIEDISGILISHEHADHISGVGTLSRTYHIPIYITNGTREAIQAVKKLGHIEPSLFREIYSDSMLKVGDIDILPFKISHDAAEPVAFRFDSDGKACAIVTDLGEYDNITLKNSRDLDAILIEANHDVHMVETSSYPYFLKQRVLNKQGHLSNDSCGQFVSKILNDKLKYIMLGHLSRENNYAELAYETVRLEIDMSDNEYMAKEFNIMVAGSNKQPCALVL